MSRFNQPGKISDRSRDDRLAPELRERRRRVIEGEATFDGDLRESRERELARAGVLPDGEITDAVSALTKQSEDGLWVARWVLAEQGSGLVVRSVTLEPIGRATPSGGVTANLLRELSPARAALEVAVGEGSADASAYWVQDLDDGTITREPARVYLRWAQEDVKAHGPARTERRRPGRPALADGIVAAVAEAYLHELRGGRGVLSRVRDQMAAGMGRKPESLPVETVRDWIRIARSRDFLTGAPKQGKRGAGAGPRLIEFRAAVRGERSE